MNRLTGLKLAVALRYLRSRGLCCLRVSLRLGWLCWLRRWSLLCLRSYVGVNLRLCGLGVAWRLLCLAVTLGCLVGRSKVRHRPVAGSILALRTSRGTSMSTGRSTNLGSSRGASLRGTLCDTCLCLCLRLWLGEVGV